MSLNKRLAAHNVIVNDDVNESENTRLLPNRQSAYTTINENTGDGYQNGQLLESQLTTTQTKICPKCNGTGKIRPSTLCSRAIHSHLIKSRVWVWGPYLKPLPVIYRFDGFQSLFDLNTMQITKYK